MDDKKVIAASLQVDTGNSVANVNEVNSSLGQTKKTANEASDALNKTGKSVADSGTNFANLKKSLSDIHPAAKAASEGTGMLNEGLNLLRANPIIATITVLVGLVLALFQPFKKMEAVSDSLGKAWGTLSGVFSAFINKVLTPLIDGFTFLVDLFTNSVVAILDTLGITSKETAERMGAITDALDDLEDSEKNAAIATAEANRKLQEAREIAGDANVPIKERIEALKLAGKIEKEELDKVVEVNRMKVSLTLEQIAMELGAREGLIASIREGSIENLKAARLELANLKNVDKEKLYALDQQIIAAENAAAQSAKIGKKTQSQIDSLNKEAEQKRKEEVAKIKAEQEKAAAEEKKYQDLKNKIVRDAELANITNEEVLAIKKQQQQFEQQKREIEALKVSNEKKKDLVAIAEKAMQNDIKKVQEKFLEERKKKEDELLKKQLEDQEKKEQKILDDAAKQIEAEEKAEDLKQKAALKRRTQQLDLQKDVDNKGLSSEELELQKLEETYKQKFDIAAGNEQLITDLTKQYENERAAIRATYQDKQLNEAKKVSDNLIGIIGKETAVGKGLGIATALINTYQGASEELRAKSTLPSPFGVIAKIANVAAILATGFKAVKAITSVQVPNAGGGGNSGASVPAPIAPASISTSLDAKSIMGVGNAASQGAGRSFVLSSDIKDNQEREARLARAARLG